MRTIRSGTLWLAVILVALVAAGAYAQQCPAPTVGATAGTMSQAAPGTVVVQAQPGTTVAVQPAPSQAAALPAPGTVAVAPAPGPAMAQPGTMVAVSPGLSEYANVWSNAPSQTITGRVVKVSRFYPGGAEEGAGLEVAMTPGFAEWDMIPDWQRQTMVARLIMVQFGPEWALAQVIPDLKPGQLVTVTGVPATWHREQVLIAEQVQVGPTVIALRTPSGMPMWAGGWQAWSTGTAVATTTVAGAPAVVTAPSIFNPATVQTVTGQVRNIRTGELVNGMGQDTILTLRAMDGQDYLVDLAPSAFLQQSGIQLARGQQVTVTGSLVTVRGRQAILATSLQAAGQQYTLRDATGAPLWTVAVLPSGQTTIVAQAQPAPGVVAPTEPISGPGVMVPQTGGQEVTPVPAPEPQEGMQTY